jgi:hypothetical protein
VVVAAICNPYPPLHWAESAPLAGDSERAFPPRSPDR